MRLIRSTVYEWILKMVNLIVDGQQKACIMRCVSSEIRQELKFDLLWWLIQPLGHHLYISVSSIIIYQQLTSSWNNSINLAKQVFQIQKQYLVQEQILLANMLVVREQNISSRTRFWICSSRVREKWVTFVLRLEDFDGNYDRSKLERYKTSLPILWKIHMEKIIIVVFLFIWVKASLGWFRLAEVDNAEGEGVEPKRAETNT